VKFINQPSSLKIFKVNPTINLHLMICIIMYFLFLGQGRSSVIQINEGNISKIDLSNKLIFHTDSSSSLNHKITLSDEIKWIQTIKGEVLNFGMTDFTYWLKLELNNEAENQYLQLGDPMIDEINLYFIRDNQLFKTSSSGSSLPFDQREVKTTKFLFNLPQGSYDCYIRLKSNFNLQVPIAIAALDFFTEEQHKHDIGLGLYFGLMLIMFFYNLFVYFSTKDKTYLFYIAYIFFVALSYASFTGLSYEFIWYNKPYVNFLIPSIASIAIIFVALFSISLLKTKTFVPKLSKLFGVFIGIFVSCVIINLFGNYQLSATVSQLFTLIFSIYLIVIAAYSYRAGAKEARFFLLAWTLYLMSIVIFILKLNGVLPLNSFTNNSVLYGSAIEVILLSFALADRINIYKEEKAQAQKKVVSTLKENEKIIREQNVLLEKKVNERTLELNQALSNLKNAQVQLVDAEKMSSLGQLTAGIAHEINNPINFVSSNISPLRQDIDDLKKVLRKYEEITPTCILKEKLHEIESVKQEVDYEYLQTELVSIISGIEDGAKRTTEIVSGLKNFSRLDEVDLQKANINQGINSSLVLIKNKLKNINLVKELGDLPMIECYPSKLNQLFMNIVDNAIYAVEAIDHGKTKEIFVKTYAENNHIILIIKDSGIGMDEATKEKIFEPFYTTKPVGDGTGLGMSITYSIVKLHQGLVEIESQKNQGTTFIIKIPYQNG
jgi:two-component system, NtrC family, sensor kinase